MRSVVTPMLAIMGIAAMSPLHAQSPPARTAASGVYTTEQAARGADVYVGQCRSCHTPDAHASAGFQSVWKDKPIAELYAYLRERMPKSEPGILSDQEYVDVLAYILRLNRLPAGDAELPADDEVLKQIRFVATTPIPVRKEP